MYRVEGFFRGVVFLASILPALIITAIGSLCGLAFAIIVSFICWLFD